MKPWLIEHQKLLTQQFSKHTLPHAILISGVKGAGKQQLSHWLIKLLACQKPTLEDDEILHACDQCKTCLLEHSNTLPDHLNLVAEKNSLGIDEVRHANTFLQKTAQLSAYKTVLIAQSESMTVAAANALLKTLEEPTDNSIIILLAEDADRLLPTIISRTRAFNIRPVVGQALMKTFEESVNNTDVFYNAGQQTSFVNLTQLPELTDQVVNEQFQQFRRTFLDYLFQKQGEGALLEQVLNNEYSLRWLEQITVGLQREKFLGTSELAQQLQLDAQVINQLYKVIINGCKVLKSYTQANKQFVCEQIVMAISDVIDQSNTR